MEKENSFLRHFITEELYIIDDSSSTDIHIAEAKTDYGTSKSGTMVVLGNPDEKENDTLTKLLASINVTHPDFSSALDILSGHKQYLLFGIVCEMEKYQIQQLDDVRVLSADSIRDLNENKELKYRLWGELQKMFL